MYIIKNFNFLNIDKLRNHFTDLPVDIYLPGNYRYRRFSCLEVLHSKIIKLHNKPLLQEKTDNVLFGGVTRCYQDLNSSFLELEEFKYLVFKFIDYCNFGISNIKLEVHQIRIVCSDIKSGQPCPEGIHKDGHDFVGIFCVNRKNIQGGETQLHTCLNSLPVFIKILEPGELLVVNDQELFHFTTPISLKVLGEAFRDVLILAAKKN
jgi:hypothetical protein